MCPACRRFWIWEQDRDDKAKIEGIKMEWSDNGRMWSTGKHRKQKEANA